MMRLAANEFIALVVENVGRDVMLEGVLGWHTRILRFRH